MFASGMGMPKVLQSKGLLLRHHKALSIERLIDRHLGQLELE